MKTVDVTCEVSIPCAFTVEIEDNQTREDAKAKVKNMNPIELLDHMNVDDPYEECGIDNIDVEMEESDEDDDDSDVHDSDRVMYLRQDLEASGVSESDSYYMAIDIIKSEADEDKLDICPKCGEVRDGNFSCDCGYDFKDPDMPNPPEES